MYSFTGKTFQLKHNRSFLLLQLFEISGFNNGRGSQNRQYLIKQLVKNSIHIVGKTMKL